MLRPSLASRQPPAASFSFLCDLRAPASVFSVLSLVFSFACELSTPRIPTLDLIMKNEKPNAELVWKQLEDLIVPRLRLSLIDRTVYASLLRHSRLEGKLRLRFSIRWLARNIGLSSGPVRHAVRRLVAHGALRLVQRRKKA